MSKESRTIGKQSFIKGALILSISMAVGKLLGALFKIPLSHLIGEVGMGYYGAAYELYAPLYALATAGFPVAISKIVSENMARGRYRDVRKVHRMSIPLFFVTGTVGFLIMVLAVPLYTTYAVKAPQCKYTMYALAPTILFTCLVSLYRGYYEGLRDMMPTAISEFIESLVKFVLGLSLAYGIMKFGLNQFYSNGTVFGTYYDTEASAINAIVPFAAAGAILAIPIGTVLALVYMVIRYKKRGDGITRQMLKEAPKSRHSSKMIRILTRTAIPIGLGAVIMNLATFIDVTLIMRRIEDIMRVPQKAQILLAEYEGLINQNIIDTNQTHIYLYGCFGFATTIMMLIPAITLAFGISALPSVSTAWAEGNRKRIKKSIETVIKMTTLFTLPAGFGLVALSYPIMDLAYGGKNSQHGVSIAASVLILLAIGGIFMSMSTPICSMLQAVGRVDLPVKLLSIGVIIKILLNYILVGIPQINIQGAGAGTAFCYGFVVVTALYFLSKETKMRFNFINILIKPLMAAALCGMTAYISYEFLSRAVSSKISTIIAILIASFIYVISLFLLNALTASDIRMLPKGEKIVKILEKVKLIG